MSTRFRIRSLAMLAVVGSALASPAREAHAGLAIAFELTQGDTTLRFFAVDNGEIPDDYTPAAGYTQVADTDGEEGVLRLGDFEPFAGYEVEGSVQEQFIATEVGQTNSLSTSALTVTNDTGGTVTATVAISGTDFNGPAFVVNSSGSITWQNAQRGSSITANWYDDPLNRQGAQSATDTPGDLVHTWTDTAELRADSGNTASGPIAVNDPANFSMALGFVLTTTDRDTIAENNIFARVVNRGQTELKDLSAVVPEPATLASVLVGLPLLGLGAWARKRRAQS